MVSDFSEYFLNIVDTNSYNNSMYLKCTVLFGTMSDIFNKVRHQNKRMHVSNSYATSSPHLGWHGANTLL